MTPNALPADPSILAPGNRLDRFELLYPLSSGGMGAVWAARLLSTHGFEKLYAVKVILPHYAEDPRFRRMFLEEARIAAGIEHPNVARIFDLGEQHGTLYLAMEHVVGASLAALHRAVGKEGRLPFSVPIALRVVADAAAGLHAAHELRDPKENTPLEVVHRDISPQNVLVSDSGMAKIIDFGIAKARGRTVGETTAGVLKGKVHFMAPEQARGQDLDRRADVFALGAVLHFLLTGRPPHEAANEVAVLHALFTGAPPTPLGEQIPRPVREVVQRAMQHDRAQRFATADELRVAIEEAMAACDLAATPQDVARYTSDTMGEIRRARQRAMGLAEQAISRQRAVQGLLGQGASLGGNSSPGPAPGDATAPSDPELATRLEGAIPVMTEPAAATPRRARAWPAAALASGAVAVAVGAGLFAWLAFNAPRAPAGGGEGAASSVSPGAAPDPPPAAPPEPSAAPSASASAAASARPAPSLRRPAAPPPVGAASAKPAPAVSSDRKPLPAAPGLDMPLKPL